jgi:hypothetical protein
MAIKKRCLRCLKVMRNDGTAENPKWVCNNPNCVRYVPPQPEPTPTEPNEEESK